MILSGHTDRHLFTFSVWPCIAAALANKDAKGHKKVQ